MIGRPLAIGMLVYPRMDQIDFTGPFEVLSRMPDAAVHVIGLDCQPVRDAFGLILTPECALDEAPPADLLHVPGGPGQQDLMECEPLLSLIRSQMESGRYVFSVCTGALLCGAAGILKGRRATTHWAAFELLPYFGAIPVNARVVVDGELITAAGVTAGIDGALTVAALLRGEEIAQGIQLAMEYAPDPPFHAGTPLEAPPQIHDAVAGRFRELTAARTATARQVAARLGVKVQPAWAKPGPKFKI
jgi:cyclohexyl-isocyanide hydratase